MRKEIEDLKDFLDFLREEGELLEIDEELSPIFEVAAAIRHGAELTGKAVLVNRVKGYSTPVVGNLFGTRRRIAVTLGVDERDVVRKFRLDGKFEKEPVTIIDNAPFKECVVTGDDVDIFKYIPVLKYSKNDVSHYITQGLVFMRDRVSGIASMGVHRLQVKGPNRLGIFLASQTSTEIFRRSEERGEDLDVAIAIGVDPYILLASTTWAPFEHKLALACCLKGSPITLTKGCTVDLLVPANAMYVLEGKIIANRREKEGPFGESTGYYIVADSPVIEVKALLCRRDPVYSVFVPWSREDNAILNVTFTPFIPHFLQRAFPGVRIKDVNFLALPGVVVMSIDKRTDVEAREVLYGLLSQFRYVKVAIVLDSDIDVYDLDQVIWAVGTRVRPQLDIVLVDNVSGSPIDPSTEGGESLTSKVGIDGTVPLVQKTRYETIGEPEHVREKVINMLKKYI